MNASDVSLEQMSFDYFPYPIGFVKNPIEEGTYKRLSENFPPLDLFKDIDPKLPGCKFSLSDVHNAGKMQDFLAANREWKDFYEYLNSEAFLRETVSVFKKNNVDLRINVTKPRPRDHLAELKNALFQWRLPHFRTPLNVRVEFSAVAAKGGYLKPHTDHPKKIITLVFGMALPGEWRDELGGATDVLVPKNPRDNFNHVNRQLEFEDTELFKRYPYGPNQCLAFVKTFNSLHSVQPTMGASVNPIRKTVTVNIIGPSGVR
jgi:hypothetical protein